MPISADIYAAITAPENAHLFTLDAALKAFSHLQEVPR
jgi:hypothetical protein